MAEMSVRLSDESGHVLTLNSDGTLPVSQGAEGAVAYSTTIFDVPGVVAANNFLSIFNPVGSGKVFLFGLFRATAWATGATSVTTSLAVWRTTAASGGTQLAAANIGKFDTANVNSVAEVRTGNPTCTLLGTVPILTVTPAITAAASGASGTAEVQPPPGVPFVVRPGEGVVARTSAGNVNQLWNMGFSWVER